VNRGYNDQDYLPGLRAGSEYEREREILPTPGHIGQSRAIPRGNASRAVSNTKVCAKTVRHSYIYIYMAVQLYTVSTLYRIELVFNWNPYCRLCTFVTAAGGRKDSGNTLLRAKCWAVLYHHITDHNHDHTNCGCIIITQLVFAHVAWDDLLIGSSASLIYEDWQRYKRRRSITDQNSNRVSPGGGFIRRVAACTCIARRMQISDQRKYNLTTAAKSSRKTGRHFGRPGSCQLLERD
jgi:hypothetical protein